MIGQKIMSDTISSTLSSTTSGIYSLLGKPSLNDSTLHYLFIEMDLESKCKCVESIYKQIEDEIEIKTDCILFCMNSVHEMLQLIQEDLQKIERKVKDHPKKWFYSYRSFDIIEELSMLKYHMKSLESRTDFLVKSIVIHKK